MNTIRFSAVLLVVVAVTMASTTAQAVILFQETFDTNTSDAPTTYTNLDWNATNVVEVVTQRAHINSFGGGQATVLTQTGFAGDITVSLDANLASNITSNNFGLQLGNIAIRSHTASNGLFRVERAVEGTDFISNTDLGWNPNGSGDGSLLHNITVFVDTVDQEFDITFTDGDNPLNTFVATIDYTQFDVNDYIPGTSVIGAVRGTSGNMYFDNIIVSAEDPPIVPEPSTLLLFGLGSLLMIGAVRRKRRKPQTA